MLAALLSVRPAQARGRQGCSIRITSVEAVDTEHNPVTYAVGQGFYSLKTTFHVEGTPAAPYKLRVRLFKYVSDCTVTPGNGDFVYYTRLAACTDEDIRWKVEVDPERVTGNTTPSEAVREVVFRQQYPEAAIERFAPRTMIAQQFYAVRWKAGTQVKRLEMRSGAPVPCVLLAPVAFQMTAGAQLAANPKGLSVVRSVTAKPRFPVSAVGSAAEVTVYNFRTNRTMLEAVPWFAAADLPADVRPFLTQYDGSDPRKIPGLMSFVRSVLSPTDLRMLTPYQAVRRLFLGVVKKLKYKVPNPGDTAVVLKRCQGDCGGFSSLFAAACRSIGIPAREIGGCTEPQQTHVWTEIYLPDAGWVPEDVTYSNGADPDGKTAFFFGVFDDGNRRFSCSMQTGWFSYNGSGPGAESTSFFIHLAPKSGR